METIYQIALIYMVVDILASLYLMVAHKYQLNQAFRTFRATPKKAPEYCCDDRQIFDDCGCEDEYVPPPKPRMKKALDRIFNLK